MIRIKTRGQFFADVAKKGCAVAIVVNGNEGRLIVLSADGYTAVCNLFGKDMKQSEKTEAKKHLKDGKAMTINLDDWKCSWEEVADSLQLPQGSVRFVLATLDDEIQTLNQAVGALMTISAGEPCLLPDEAAGRMMKPGAEIDYLTRQPNKGNAGH